MTIEGVGQNSTYTRGVTTLNLHSRIDEGVDISFNAYILNSITSSTPAIPVNTAAYEYLSGLQLAVPTFGLPGCIDLLIGADIWSTILQDGVVSGGCDKPCALRTRPGWILRKFWDAEEPPEGSYVEDCEQIFMDTFSRNPDGRYVVQILFRFNAPALGNSHRGALRQFFHLERKLAGDADLRNRYIQFMREYEQLGHMQHLRETEVNYGQCYYIPHHAVTAKFRVVFNASAKSSNDISLNDTQLVGPQLQDNLVHILHRFRRFQVAIKADVEKMFRQVEVDKRHRKWQQILWRESTSEPIRTYQLNTVTYGMACGPYNAIRALRQCASDNFSVIHNVNRAAEAKESILSNFYVDDYLDSVDTTTEAIERAR
ncbi:PREDICTED: uncharacterized protein LOC108359785 [Rhagoletis zephyria]|uniref:uncharacterized protein LOC108359785 n=1 Tax=Rhagoletis zephyria TaxID=28612 RepID=UPI000811A79F|nr:PREDICTED: uncharacterized protein LOC108359785 [Rhagoletis zephyria]